MSSCSRETKFSLGCMNPTSRHKGYSHDTAETTRPHRARTDLEKLERHPGSVVLIAIQIPEVCNFTRTTWAWLSREERKALRCALESARKKREKSRDVDRSDLAAVSEPNDSEQSL